MSTGTFLTSARHLGVHRLKAPAAAVATASSIADERDSKGTSLEIGDFRAPG